MVAASVLVVDDDASVGRALKRLVNAMDADCAVCSSGDEMLELVAQARPTFVLLDVHMPDRSGVESLREMRARGFDVPTVMMTGIERDDTRAVCLSAGAVDLLAKPVGAAEIGMLLGRFTQG
jgi:DNA-binding response OmpR family regulator